MIRKQRTLFYFVGDNVYKSLEEAQEADLKTIIPAELFPAQVSEWLLKNSAAVVDILTTTPTSRLKSRKLHGGTRNSKANACGFSHAARSRAFVIRGKSPSISNRTPRSGISIFAFA